MEMRPNKVSIAIILMLCISSLPFANILAQKRYVEELKHEFVIGPGAQATIKSSFGPIQIVGISGNTAYINVLKRGTAKTKKDAKRFVKAAKVKVVGAKGMLSVVSSRPKSTNFGKGEGYEVLIRIKLPISTMVNATNSFGEISVDEIQGKLDLSGKHGSIAVKGAKDIIITNSFGSIQLLDIGGNMKVRNQHGSIRCREVQGGEIRNEFGSIDIKKSYSWLKIANKMGSIRARSIVGATITNQFGEVDIRLAKSFTGKVRAETSFGSIETNLGIRVKEKMHDKRLQGTVGKNGKQSLKVSNQHGSITINK
jgi:putative adhesin